jgi:glycosyltransferase involved in cell wall biosynthesis
VVVDDGSTDNTVKIAKKLKAEILTHPLKDFAAQHNWTMENIKSNWLFFVDADEVVPQRLAGEILEKIKNPNAIGYYLRRTDIMWNKKLRFGDVLGAKFIRLGRRGSGHWEGAVHETWKIDGVIGELKHPLHHYPHPNLVAFLVSLNKYSSMRAEELYAKGERSNLFQIFLYPILKFKHLYIFKLGFLDGTVGFIHAMCMAFYSFLVRGKLYLLHKKIGVWS